MACSFLDILKAADAYRNGEPGVIVAWMGASTTISALSGILVFYAFNAKWSFGITLVLALITIALAILTMQELTLPQRLWVHRSVFGRPNHNYYNSEPFGGDKPRSLPNDPAAADEWKDYQRRALNEEAQALGMLVTGITLEVSTKIIIDGATAVIPKFYGTGKNIDLEVKLSIPESLNGNISINIMGQDNNNPDLIEPNHIKLNYRKDKNKIKTISQNEYINEEDMILEKGSFIKKLRHEIPPLKNIEIEFKFYEESNIYIPMAGDKFKIRG